MRKPERFAPPGMELGPWRNYTATVLVICILFAFYHFGFEMLHARAKLFDPVTGELKSPVGFWRFDGILGNSTKGFSIFAATMAAFVVLNYLYFFEGSKSIYTMARVKSFWELHIRCWTLPACSAAVLLICRVVLALLFYLIFVLATPRGVPVPGWRQLLGGLLS